MSDELSFLRWVYQNVTRFIHGRDGEQYVARDELAAAYSAETGNSAPGDYRLVL